MSYHDRRSSPMPDGRYGASSYSNAGGRETSDKRYFDRSVDAYRDRRTASPYRGDIELQVPERRPADFYDDDRRSYIERGRGSQKSRGSQRSRGSYSSSPRYSAKPLEARIKHCCRVTIAFIFSNVGVCGLFVGYTIMGSFLFQVISL